MESWSPEREEPETASSIQTFWARPDDRSYGTGPQGGGEDVGPHHTPSSHLEKQREAKHKAHLEEPVSTGMFQAHLGGQGTVRAKETSAPE